MSVSTETTHHVSLSISSPRHGHSENLWHLFQSGTGARPFLPLSPPDTQAPLLRPELPTSRKAGMQGGQVSWKEQSFPSHWKWSQDPLQAPVLGPFGTDRCQSSAYMHSGPEPLTGHRQPHRRDSCRPTPPAPSGSSQLPALALKGPRGLPRFPIRPIKQLKSVYLRTPSENVQPKRVFKRVSLKLLPRGRWSCGCVRNIGSGTHDKAPPTLSPTCHAALDKPLWASVSSPTKPKSG